MLVLGLGLGLGLELGLGSPPRRCVDQGGADAALHVGVLTREELQEEKEDEKKQPEKSGTTGSTGKDTKESLRQDPAFIDYIRYVCESAMFRS